MGANHLKEIESYCRITLPTHGIITNCGKAHLEGFGSEEGVRKGKGELFDFLRANNGTAFVMWDYEYLQQMSKGISTVIRYGTKNAEVEGIAKQKGEFLSVKMTKGMNSIINTKLVGDYNLPNILAAVSIGKHFGVADEKIVQAIEKYIPSNSRSQLIEKGKNKFILDAYNANPSSMKLAIENFAKSKAENKILMLGGMAELGADSLNEHKIIIELIKKYSWKEVALVGGSFLQLEHPWHRFENSSQAKEWFLHNNFQNCFILVKGSRSMQMEKILDQ
jgi:UDP-N-acetylmuramoyl-tripeptide--D-alanyl-D-alanine ligase